MSFLLNLGQSMVVEGGKRGLGAIHGALAMSGVSDAKSLEEWILNHFEHYVVLDHPKVEFISNKLSIEVGFYC